MNNPIPAPTAILIDNGIQSAILSRIPPKDKIKKKHPDKNTIPKAVSQVTPLSMTKVKVKKAFNPIPGANPNGAFAQTPEINVPNAVAKQVTVIRAPLSIPVKLKIEGLTKIIYAIAKKVDRKSTRLNSSHANISYAVFCLKKKNNIHPFSF